MKIFKLLVLAFVVINVFPAPSAEAICYNIVPAWNNSFCTAPAGTWGGYTERGRTYNYPPPDYVTATCAYAQSGYTCTRFGNTNCTVGGGGWNGYTCTRNNFSATQSGGFTLIGKNVPSSLTSYSIQITWEAPSPFIYFYNAPEGEVTVRLDSQLDSYAPLPAFNQESGWDLTVKDSALYLDDTAIDHVFYELALNKIALTRNGRNFESKDEVITYLKNSDFLTKLGFSEQEKNNSLGYLIPEIEAAADSEYYYLTILEDESIAESGTLTVTPTPDKIDRKYFAVYPSAAPVVTTGDFAFPPVEPIEGFTVKETGEFLINQSMFVFFK